MVVDMMIENKEVRQSGELIVPMIRQIIIENSGSGRKDDFVKKWFVTFQVVIAKLQ